MISLGLTPAFAAISEGFATSYDKVPAFVTAAIINGRTRFRKWSHFLPTVIVIVGSVRLFRVTYFIKENQSAKISREFHKGIPIIQNYSRQFLCTDKTSGFSKPYHCRRLASREYLEHLYRERESALSTAGRAASRKT